MRLAKRRIKKRVQSIAEHLVESIMEGCLPEPRENYTKNNISPIPSMRPNFLGYQLVLSFLSSSIS